MASPKPRMRFVKVSSFTPSPRRLAGVDAAKHAAGDGVRIPLHGS